MQLLSLALSIAIPGMIGARTHVAQATSNSRRAAVQANTAQPVRSIISGLIGIHMVSSTAGWAWSLTKVFRTYDAGRTWHVVTPKATPSFDLFRSGSTPQDTPDGNVFFVGSDDAWFIQSWFPRNPQPAGGVLRVFRTTDGGKSWAYATLRNPGTVDEANGAPYFLNQRDGWLLTYGRGDGHATLWRTGSGGATWSIETRLDRTAVGFKAVFSAATGGWVASGGRGVSARPAIWSTADAGEKWVADTLPLPFSTQGCFVNLSDPVVLGTHSIALPFQRFCPGAGMKGGIAFAVTRDGGSRWRFGTGLSPTSDGIPPRYDFLGPRDVWLANGQDLYRSVNGGLTWQWTPAEGGAWRLVRANKSNGIDALSAVSPKMAWALVTTGRYPSMALIRTTDGGTHWTTVGALALANSTTKIQTTGTHIISLGQVSLRVPNQWTLGMQVHVSESNALNADWVGLPKVGRNADLALNVKNASPFFSETIVTSGATVGLDLWELSASGKTYSVSITVPLGEKAILQRVASRVSTPPVATATEAVGLLHHAHSNVETVRTAAVGSDKWLLVEGSPATAQQQFVLYRSTDNGVTWSLVQSTRFVGKGDFMGVLGQATVFFWTQSDGLIAESTGFGPPNTLLVYRTTTGGRVWSSREVAIRGSVDGSSAPTITRSSAGTLVIDGQTTEQTTFKVESVDGGKTWAPVP